jgi:multiple antibiotic resistance protein
MTKLVGLGGRVMEIIGPLGSYFLKLFVVVNPHIVVPFFFSCTQNYTSYERKAVGLKMCFYGLLLGLSFALFGVKLLSALGISHTALRAGGGLLLGVAAWGLLYSERKEPAEGTEPEQAIRQDISLCPLAFPMFIGPATITTLVGMMHEAESAGKEHVFLVLTALVSLIALTYVLIICGSGFMKLLGHKGSIILEKIAGILLIALSGEMILGSIKKFFQ